MRHFKTFAIALAIMVGTNTFANSEPVSSKNKKDSPFEVKDLFKHYLLTYHKDLYGKVVFSLDEDRKIVVHSVATQDDFLREYVMKQMKDRVLKGEEWEIGKPYILPLRVKMTH